MSLRSLRRGLKPTLDRGALAQRVLKHAGDLPAAVLVGRGIR